LLSGADAWALTGNTGMTLREIQVKIAKEELILTEDGVEVEQESTPSTFIMMGLNLEDVQYVLTKVLGVRANGNHRRRLEIDIKALKNPSAT
jgi:hypothetical protein